MATFDVEEFLAMTELSCDHLKSLKKDDLITVCDHLGVSLAPGLKKAGIVDLLASHMKLTEESETSVIVSDDAQIQLAKFEMEMKMKENVEKERIRENLEMEKINIVKERMRLEYQLKLKEMELAHANSNTNSVKDKSPQGFDVAKNIRLVPKFDEEGVDTYFVSFEKVAKRLNWPEEYWTLLLQSVFVGKAAKVYSSLSEMQSCDYATVKETILNAYELVPEAYRHKFRNMQRQSGQTYVEFAREQEMMFDRWYRSLKVDKDFVHLREVVLLEEFKKSLPFGIKSHLDDHRVTEVSKAAIVADEFEVTHKSSGDRPPFKNYWKKKGKGSFESHNKPSEGKYASKEKDTNKNQASGGTESTKRSESRSSKICTHCHKSGHLKESCWKLVGMPTKVKKDMGFVKQTSVPSMEFVPLEPIREVESVSLVFADKVKQVDETFRSFLYDGEVSPCSTGAAGRSVVILRDTGAAQSLMVPGDLALPPESSENAKVLVQGIGPNFMSVPLYKVDLKCDLVSGPVTVGVVPELPMKDDILMRKWRPPRRPADEDWCIIHQVVVPPCYRTDILKMAHELPMAGHVGIRKTEDRIMRHFYWPKMHKDVVHFCKTCHTCQIIGKAQPSIKPAPLIPIPAFDEPFTRVLVDCVGPLPRTRSGHIFLLTIMDLSTRFPEAIPLRSITAKTVVQALV
ncbi:uncharacterized protein LOC135157629 [Lytechinus pictus]|uniref:uncharacterized protein LOC135157629 n=1 Tax=Lytechinus pictus TaxID=7653 RepID=UPI0030B9C767